MVICEIKEEKRGDGWREEKGGEFQKEEEREFSKKVGRPLLGREAELLVRNSKKDCLY